MKLEIDTGLIEWARARISPPEPTVGQITDYLNRLLLLARKQEDRAERFDGSATVRRFRRMEVARAYDVMSDCNELQQAERIARHYLSHAATAKHLLEIVRATQGHDLTDDTKQAIKYCADQIRNNHAHELGIELDWPNE